MWSWYWRFKLRALRQEEADFVARLARIREHIREHESVKGERGREEAGITRDTAEEAF